MLSRSVLEGELQRPVSDNGGEEKKRAPIQFQYWLLVVSAEMTEEVPVPREELNEPGTEYTCRWVMVRI